MVISGKQMEYKFDEYAENQSENVTNIFVSTRMWVSFVASTEAFFPVKNRLLNTWAFVMLDVLQLQFISFVDQISISQIVIECKFAHSNKK